MVARRSSKRLSPESPPPRTYAVPMLNVGVVSGNELASLVVERLTDHGAVIQARSAPELSQERDSPILVRCADKSLPASKFDLVLSVADGSEQCCPRHSPDVVLTETDPGLLRKAVDQLWENRLLPFSRNKAAPRPKHRKGPAVMSPPDPAWPATAARTAERILRTSPLIVRVDHIGSTSIPGLPAKNVIDLQVGVANISDLDQVSAHLDAAGYRAVPGKWWDAPTSYQPEPEQWAKHLHVNSDPAQNVNIHVRVVGSAGWFFTLSFRDWMRADAGHVRRYAAEKQRIASKYANDVNALNYAAEKKLWFRDYVEPQLYAWVDSHGWRPEKQEEPQFMECSNVAVNPNTVTAPEFSPAATRLLS